LLTLAILELILTSPTAQTLVNTIVAKAGGAITDALTPTRELTRAERRDMTEALVGSLEDIGQLVTTRRQYYGLLVATCFDVAETVEHGILVEDLFAQPWRFFFPVPPEDAEPVEREQTVGRETIFCLSANDEAQTFYAIRRVDGGNANISDLQDAYELEGTDTRFIASMKSNAEYELVALLGVSDGRDAQTLNYVPSLLTDPQIELVPNAHARTKLKSALLAALR
jgi:hypothetical protein